MFLHTTVLGQPPPKSAAVVRVPLMTVVMATLATAKLHISHGGPTVRFVCPVLNWEPWLHLHLIGPCSHLPPESDSLGSCSICHPKVAALALVASATQKWQPWLLLGTDLSWQLFGPRILILSSTETGNLIGTARPL